MSSEQTAEGRVESNLQTFTGQRWLVWGGTLAVIAAGGAVLLRVLRQYPEGVHSDLNAAPSGIRWAAASLASLGVTLLLFRLLNPRWALANYFRNYPPGWSAWAVAAALIAAVDVFGGLGSEVYRGAWWEWLLYGGGSVAAVAFYRKFTAGKKPEGEEEEDNNPATSSEVQVEDVAAPVSLTELAKSWHLLEKWLSDDKPAEDDFIGNRRVALRLARFLVGKGGTVGLVGPYGSGKTSIIAWLKEYARKVRKREYPTNPELWFCSVSCWGFEDSASAVSQILSKAVSTVGERVDCFSIRHLPESYRKTFSAGGDWVRTLFDLVVGTADPLGQFQSLSGILKTVNARLVVVVEDLDRTSSSRFDRKELAALLYRLKETEKVSFILAAGQSSSSDIDFAKICENIELVKEFEPEEIATVIRTVRAHCLADFKHVPTTATESPWNRVASWFSVTHDRIAPGEAAARLLRTPRGLKQALAHTYRAWQKMYGEVDFDHLFAANILRHSAPEAFDYLLCRWVQLRDDPRNWGDDKKQLPAIQKRYQEEWERTTSNVEWSARAALGIIEFLLPSSAEYLQSLPAFSTRTIQGIREKRYWERVVNQHVDPTHVRDQVVIADIQEWLSTKEPCGKLVAGLLQGGDYVRVFDHFAPDFFRESPDDVLLLAEQVLAGLRSNYGVRAAENDPRDGLDAMRRLTTRVQPADMETGRRWLEREIERAMAVSLPLTNEIYRAWTVASSPLIRLEERADIRRLAVRLAREQWRCGDDLLKVLHPSMPFDLLRFLRPAVDNDYGGQVFKLEDFAWLRSPLLEALRKTPDCVAPKLAYLFGEQLHGPRRVDWVHRLDVDQFTAIFGDASGEVLDAIEEYAARADGPEKEIMTQLATSGKTAYKPQAEPAVTTDPNTSRSI